MIHLLPIIEFILRHDWKLLAFIVGACLAIKLAIDPGAM